MKTAQLEIHVQKIQELAAEYRRRGYDVVTEPTPDLLPDFLAGFQPDLIARSPQESIVIEVKVGVEQATSERYKELAETIRAHPGWRFSLVVIDPRAQEVTQEARQLLSEKEIRARLQSAEQLLARDTTDAAFLSIWSVVEALLRHIVTREGLPLERLPTSALLKELFSQGLISQTQFNTAREALSIRNAVAHGFEGNETAGAGNDLLNLANQLLEELKQPGP